MGKAAKIFLVYYIFLGLVSLVFSLLKLEAFTFAYGGGRTDFNPIWIPTMIGGMVALSFILPARSFKLFVIVYFSLWVMRFILLYIGNKLGEVVIFERHYHFEKIFNTYYKNVSRLDTHLPFVLYWFANYLFTVVIKQEQQVKEEHNEAGKQIDNN